MANLYNVLLNIKKTIKQNWNFVKKLLNKTGISPNISSCDKAIYEISKEISGGQWGNLSTWYSNREVSTLRKIFFALLERKWVEVGSVWYRKTRHCMVPWKSKVTYNLSFFKKLSFLTGHHPYCLSVVKWRMFCLYSELTN